MKVFFYTIQFRDSGSASYTIHAERDQLLRDFRGFLAGGTQEFSEYTTFSWKAGSNDTVVKMAGTLILDFRAVAAISVEVAAGGSTPNAQA